MNFPSSLVENAVNQISRLPGIGKKSALRLVLHLLKENEDVTDTLSKALIELRKNIKYCKKCHSISDHDFCNICTAMKRDKQTVCVVEGTKDVLAIENTGQYFGVYHVLGGIISPMEGISPTDLNIDTLLKRVREGEISEIILALNATMEGDTTAFYLTKKLKGYQVKISSIARGVPVGSELEFTDEVTLARSIVTRTEYLLNRD